MKLRSITALAAAIIGAGTATMSSAAIRNIAVNNYSFETPTTYVQNAQTFGNFTDGVPGWVFQCDAAAGQNTRDNPTYPLSNGSLPGGDGATLAFFNNPAAGQQARAFSQDLPETIQPNTAYTLTIALGNPSRTNINGEGYRDPGNYRIQLLSDFHAEVAGLDVLGTSIPDGSLVDYSVTLTSGAAGVDPLVGHALLIQVSVASTAANEQSSFDNVRLTATDVPEPASLGLLGLAGVAITRRRRGN